MKYCYILLSLFFIVSYSSAQRCGHDLLHEKDKTENPELYKLREDFKYKINKILQEKKNEKLSSGEEVLSIPVVVHVIHNNVSGATGGASNPNITDAQIFSQIQILNEDYRRLPGTNGFNSDLLSADTKIEFCLASLSPTGTPTNGIVRVFNSKSSWSVSDEFTLKSKSYWPSDQYLNIWVCRLSGGVLGYSPYPAGSGFPELGGDSGANLDGVVVDFRAFGNTGAAQSPYNMGRTTTHEVGHWLGLIHLWGDDPGSGCNSDFVSDTPIDEGPNLDLDCLDSSDCDGDLLYLQDLTNNYMDYSRDLCMNLFTVGQKDRMRAVMQNSPRRLALKNSPGCCLTASTLTYIPFQEGFESTAYLSEGWQIEDDGADLTTWDETNPGAFNTSMNSVFMDNDAVVSGEIDFLLTPFLSFAGIKPFMEFDLAYAADPIAAISDTLVVSYNTNCVDWNILTSYHGSSLVTSTASSTNFIPMEDDWKRVKVDLAALRDKPVARLRFENRSAAGNKLYIDNVNIYKVSDRLTVRPYPNPATDILNLEIIFSGEQDVTYEMYDLIGQKVFQFTETGKVSHIKSIDVSSIARGMYIVKVSIKGQSVTNKVLINY